MENKKRSIIGIVLMSALLGLGMIYLFISRVIYAVRGMVAEANGFLLAGLLLIGMFLVLGILMCRGVSSGATAEQGKKSGDQDGEGH